MLLQLVIDNLPGKRKTTKMHKIVQKNSDTIYTRTKSKRTFIMYHMIHNERKENLKTEEK